MTGNTVFSRFAPFLQDFIYRAEWKSLRPVQIATAQAIFDSQCDVLITAGTASGKTEAAFLPILSLIHQSPQKSIQVLYVGPLRALINDQFARLDALCEAGHIPVHRWHGDVGQSHKVAVIDRPSGILQITPESIESLLINRQDKLHRLFHGLAFVVIDELHTFLGTDRGVQLASQLKRLERYAETRPRRIGLSATIGDADVARHWLNPNTPEQATWINPPNADPSIRLSHLHFVSPENELPIELVEDIYQLTRNRKTLIFCNSRKAVELLTDKLNKRCKRDQINERYLPHHGSINKDLRELAEAKMKDDLSPASVICTSTLELGIDIGQLDLVVQFNATHSVSAFAQRLGRSGRREQGIRTMQLYSTQATPEEHASFYALLPFRLLQALAVVDLFKEGWVEPPTKQDKSYNALCHQILSYLVECNGTPPRELVARLSGPGPFASVPMDDYAVLLKHLASTDHIQQMSDGQFILGLAGEKVVRSRDFYALFQTSIDWDVFHGTRNLGRITPTMDLDVGICLLLGGKVWEVTEMLPGMRQIMVRPAQQSDKTMFEGGAIDLHAQVSQRMRELLSREDIPPYLSEDGVLVLTEARRLSKELGLDRREVFAMGNQWVWLPWTGTQIARTLRLLLKRAGISAKFEPSLAPWVLLIAFEGSLESLGKTFRSMLTCRYSAEELLGDCAVEELRTHKFDELLPDALLRKRAMTEWIDVDGAYTAMQYAMESIS